MRQTIEGSFMPLPPTMHGTTEQPLFTAEQMCGYAKECVEKYTTTSALPSAPIKALHVTSVSSTFETASNAPPSPVEDPLWQKLRDLFGLDGWHDGHYNGIATPEQIVTHCEYVSGERARLLFQSMQPK